MCLKLKVVCIQSTIWFYERKAFENLEGMPFRKQLQYGLVVLSCYEQLNRKGGEVSEDQPEESLHQPAEAIHQPAEAIKSY